MRFIRLGLSLAVACSIGLSAEAGVVLDTYTIATQTITSPLVDGGTQTITAAGPQHFTFDLATHIATVMSSFTGNDLHIAAAFGGGTVSYDLYNTTTTGTVFQNGSGTYDIDFPLLFELKVTSPTSPLFGATIETLTPSNFSVHGLASLYLPPGTVFKDLTGGTDTTLLYNKSDPTLPVGTSSGRTVTIDSVVVPEPSTALLGALALGLTGVAVAGKRRASVRV